MWETENVSLFQIADDMSAICSFFPFEKRGNTINFSYVNKKS